MMSKSTAFVIGLCCLMAIFIVNAVKADTTQYGAIIAGIVSLTTLYMGSKVANNCAMGAFYRPELDHSKDKVV